MKNLPVPESYTVSPNARLKAGHDTSRLPRDMMLAFNVCVSSRESGNSRSELMTSDIADELIVGRSMYTTHPVPGLRDGSFVALHQMAEHAWNRTFAERLEEAVRKYKDVDRDTLQRDLTIAWWNIEQIITSYDATS